MKLALEELNIGDPPPCRSRMLSKLLRDILLQEVTRSSSAKRLEYLLTVLENREHHHLGSRA